MATAKTSRFSERHRLTAQLAQALTHLARLAILQLMADRQRRLSGDITAALPMLARTTASQHLVALRKLGLLRAQANHATFTMTYWLDVDNVREMKRQLNAFFFALSYCPLCQKEACGCVDLSYAD